MSRPVRRRLAVIAAAAAAPLAIGNLAILGIVALARSRDRRWSPLDLAGAPNAYAVDGTLWRSGKLTADQYRLAAAAGAAAVVDLRAERDIAGPPPDAALGYTRIPLRDGQPPSPDQVDEFLHVHRRGEHPLLVHCSAGVGRSGSTVAAYEVMVSGRSPTEALTGMLAVGPPSLEQIAFVLMLRPDGARRPPAAVVVISRLLDAPRRTWSRLRHWAKRRAPRPPG